MKPYRSCSCRDPGTGKRYPTSKPKKGEKYRDGHEKAGQVKEDERCPVLVKSSSHGAWFARFEAPAPKGQRRQLRVGPYATRAGAQAAAVEAAGDVKAGTYADDRQVT